MTVKKITKLTMFIVALVVALDSFSWAFRSLQYESRGRRDPFVPLVGVEKPAIARLEDITSIEDIRLEGIAIAAKGIRVAILNGEMLKENNKVGEIEIKKIYRKYVIISISGKEYNVNLSEEGGVKSE